MTVHLTSAPQVAGDPHRGPRPDRSSPAHAPTSARVRRIVPVAVVTLALALAGCSTEPDTSEVHTLLDELPGVESVTVPCTPNETGPVDQTCTVEIEVAASATDEQVAEIIRAAKDGTREMIATTPVLETAGDADPDVSLALGTLAENRADGLARLWNRATTLEGASAVAFTPVGVESAVQDYAARITPTDATDEDARTGLSTAFDDSDYVTSTELN